MIHLCYDENSGQAPFLYFRASDIRHQQFRAVSDLEVDDTVLCKRCEETLDNLVLDLPVRDRQLGLETPYGSLLCSRCGTMLPTNDPAEAMLSKLSQLSKFGLGADDRPLLAFAREGKSRCVAS